MKRITKKPKERRLEIMNIANELFQSKGYNKVSVNLIIEKVGIAKGTFYHYFKSKEELLSAIADNALEEIIQSGEKIISNQALSAMKKMRLILSVQGKDNKKAKRVAKVLHEGENRELHEKINIQIVTRLSPLLAEIIDQGKREGVFKVEKPLETIQFLLVGSQFMFDEGLFQWDKKEWTERRKVMQVIIEKSLGAKKGSFNFLKK